ncbi:MAG: hypothetical protein ABIR68_01660 [Ilumatobacteraceae bacterium]
MNRNTPSALNSRRFVPSVQAPTSVVPSESSWASVGTASTKSSRFAIVCGAEVVGDEEGDVVWLEVGAAAVVVVAAGETRPAPTVDATSAVDLDLIDERAARRLIAVATRSTEPTAPA